jgi:hypothetical protein
MVYIEFPKHVDPDDVTVMMMWITGNDVIYVMASLSDGSMVKFVDNGEEITMPTFFAPPMGATRSITIF